MRIQNFGYLIPGSRSVGASKRALEAGVALFVTEGHSSNPQFSKL
jgi:hypothetical protein